jgi:hypothetical protein
VQEPPARATTESAGGRRPPRWRAACGRPGAARNGRTSADRRASSSAFAVADRGRDPTGPCPITTCPFSTGAIITCPFVTAVLAAIVGAAPRAGFFCAGFRGAGICRVGICRPGVTAARLTWIEIAAPGSDGPTVALRPHVCCVNRRRTRLVPQGGVTQRPRPPPANRIRTVCGIGPACRTTAAWLPRVGCHDTRLP